MNKKVVIPRERTGVALVISVGILALLAVIATGFAINMQVELKAASNYCDSVRAQSVSDVGIGLAIGKLRNLACTSQIAPSAAPNDWHYADPAHPSFDSFDGTTGNSTSAAYNLGASTGIGANIGTCSLQVVDTASQININDVNPNLGSILESLVTILRGLGAPLQANDGYLIAAGRPYATKEEIMLKVNGFDRAKYNAIKDFITTNSYIDRNSEGTQLPQFSNQWNSSIQAKAPININTARSEVLRAVLAPIVGDAKAQLVVTQILSQRNSALFATWYFFEAFMNNAMFDPFGGNELSGDERTAIINNANPNHVKLESDGDPLSYYTTDFCFHPSGIYEITSTSRVGLDMNGDFDLADAGDIIRSEKSITALVKIYDILYYTTKEQFRGEDLDDDAVFDAGEDTNGNGKLDAPNYQDVTWLNSCPINASDLFVQYAAPSNTCPHVYGALKSGFWDNFDESTVYSVKNWAGPGTNNTVNPSDFDADLDNELVPSGFGNWPKYVLGNPNYPNRWLWHNFSMRVFNYDDESWMDFCKYMINVGQILFRGTNPGDPIAFHGLNKTLTWDAGAGLYAYETPPGSGIITFWTDIQAEFFGYDPANRYVYPSSIRMYLNIPVANSVENYDTPEYRSLLAYTAQKTLNLHATGPKMTLSCYAAALSALPLTRTSTRDTTGRIGLYGSVFKAVWDDVRIIPSGSTYTFPCQMAGTSLVKWGTISFTATAQTNTTVDVLTSVDGGGTFQSKTNNGPIGETTAPRNSIYYRVNFATTPVSENNYLNTPILEDVTITYLPPTKVLYRR